MLKRLQIQNFRGFNALEINPLSGINLIAGKNNSGKTNLLEAIFLLAGGGDAQLAVNTNVVRGIEKDGVPVSDPFWKQLFFKLDIERSIKIEGEHKSQGRFALEIASEQQPTTEITLNSTDGVSVTNLFDERSLIFQYSDPSPRRGKSLCYLLSQMESVPRFDTGLRCARYAATSSNQVGNPAPRRGQ